MELTIGALREPSVEDLEVEVVERKGIGHPDTICDGLAEQLSVSLSRFYLERFGLILHHNVDKVLLRAGSARPAFGGGEVLEPMEIFLAGRATSEFRGTEIPVTELAIEGSRSWFRRSFHALDPGRHVKLQCLTRPGSADLVELFLRSRRQGVWLANDTSIGAGFAPMSDLEKVVAAVEARLNASDVKAACPEVGEDIKVMGIRLGGRIRLTVSCAFLGRFLADTEDYLEKKERARGIALDAARAATGRDVSVEVNTADDPAQGSLYLTVTGTSAEAGDDGEAGRGNRANGLITPYRPMTLEAAAGKNPVSHVGKLYQIASRRIAESMVTNVPGVAAAECCLVSQIGRPVADPWIADIRVRLRDGRPAGDLAPELEAVLRDQLARLETVWREVLDGQVRMY
ncbi:MAG TPA: methionine adenosyltransferase [Thermoanaerobaculia bacterium]|nr:methionine adenosyltransferase [Thermoanaerobaculia bacterium]